MMWGVGTPPGKVKIYYNEMLGGDDRMWHRSCRAKSGDEKKNELG